MCPSVSSQIKAIKSALSLNHEGFQLQSYVTSNNEMGTPRRFPSVCALRILKCKIRRVTSMDEMRAYRFWSRGVDLLIERDLAVEEHKLWPKCANLESYVHCFCFEFGNVCVWQWSTRSCFDCQPKSNGNQIFCNKLKIKYINKDESKTLTKKHSSLSELVQNAYWVFKS